MTNRFARAALHLEIAALVKSGKISIHGTQIELAKKHKVSRQRIGQIVNKIRRNRAVERPRIGVADRRRKVAEILATEGKPSWARILEISAQFGVTFSAIYKDIKAINAAMPDIAPTAAKSSALKARIVDETSCRYGDVGEVSEISDAGIFVRFEDGCLGRFAKAACRVRIPAEVT